MNTENGQLRKASVEAAKEFEKLVDGLAQRRAEHVIKTAITHGLTWQGGPAVQELQVLVKAAIKTELSQFRAYEGTDRARAVAAAEEAMAEKQFNPKCAFCQKVSTKLCDYPLDKQHTCDMPMSSCAQNRRSFE